MPKVLIFQHVPHEILGTLNPKLKEAGFRIKYTNFGRHPNANPNIDAYEGLIVLGGPMNVGQEHLHPHLTTEMRIIEKALKKDIPVLGICLGSQLIAKTLGANVKPNSEKEIGWYDIKKTKDAKEDPFFSHFQDSEKIFQWHGYTFDIPKNANHLAFSEYCQNQAFRYGDKVYGLQFHMEVTQQLIESWMNVPHNKKELEELKGEICPETIKEETKKHIKNLTTLSNNAFQEFINLFGKNKKNYLLGSR